ncbi:MAG: tRNA 4-thiouridine(8) synthase ThiI [Alicyclobacillus sp.]|nr:tRNA 4-thiouridine(8) synthase ThiI [Alicyclobacillus sp.]
MIRQVIARYGELSLKGKNRHQFEERLVGNMRRVVADVPGVRIARQNGRVLITLDDAPVDVVISRLKNVFGIVSLSPVEVTGLALEEMVQAALRVRGEEARRLGLSAAERSFKVEAKRVNKRYPLTSMEVASEVGGQLLAAETGWTVDVHHPAVTVFVEVRDEEALVYGVKVPALGGLPVGTSGRVGLLLSGGIDSPVAGWLALKRGVELDAIHFHSFPFTSQRALDKVETLAQTLANWGGRVRLHTVHFTDVQTEIRKHCPENLTITVMRRMMMRISERIAEQNALLALVTGESLGQVASQTLESLRVINAVTRLPVLRPLIAEDKVSIIRLARQIGTYETSILPYEDCCTIFVPKQPRTKPGLAETERAEQDLDVERLVSEAVARTETKVFSRRSPVG